MSGLLLEMALAWRYGASATVDAFRIAALLGGFGIQLFFGYLLPHIVVPMFAEYRAKGMEQEGWRLAFWLALILSSVSLLFVWWVWFYPDALLRFLGPGLEVSGYGTAVLLLRCFSLALVLMAWSGVASGILYVQRIFWLSALAQIVPNLLIVSALLIGEGVTPLALGILLGYAAMLAMFVYGVLRIGRRSQVNWRACLKPVSREGLRKVLKLSWPLLAGILLGQWSIIIINRVLSELPPGTLAEFGYAWKLLALVGLLPAGLATVIFPAFSEANAMGNAAELSRLAARAVRMTLLLTLPLAAVLIVEREPLVNLMFGQGRMSEAALKETATLLGILLVSAPAGALAGALNKVAFARHDSKSPAVVALFSALALTFLLPMVAQGYGASGVVWLLSLVGLAGALLMAGHLSLYHRVLNGQGLLRYVFVLSVLCAGTAFPVMLVHILFANAGQVRGVLALIELVLAGLISGVCIYGLSRLMGLGETGEILAYLRWQFRQLPFFRKSRSLT
ncbi:MAG TPA: lipid II flippase MurJ [Gallionella sp.]|nr:lipid II flippase MurJ [Gallionella sp.]